MKFGSGLHKVPTSDADWNRSRWKARARRSATCSRRRSPGSREYGVTEVVTCAYTFTADERFLAQRKRQMPGRLGLLRPRLQIRRGGRPAGGAAVGDGDIDGLKRWLRAEAV